MNKKGLLERKLWLKEASTSTNQERKETKGVSHLTSKATTNLMGKKEQSIGNGDDEGRKAGKPKTIVPTNKPRVGGKKK